MFKAGKSNGMKVACIGGGPASLSAAFYLAQLGYAVTIYDKNDKPLLSWRVAVLPYLEAEDLFKEFKLDEP